MREGIDAPLCGGSNRCMDPRTGLPYFPNQRLSGNCMGKRIGIFEGVYIRILLHDKFGPADFLVHAWYVCSEGPS